MVCEKIAGSTHYFLTDPIRTIIRDGRLYADGTTLGGDDGVAVAIMLALLTDRTLSAPRLECLFTSDEETGLYGAKAFDCTQITARRMINLDSEEEGVATIGCAGGAVSTLTMTNEVLPPVGKPIHIRLFGLAGGHSGAEIHRGRANAIVLMARLLDRLYSFAPFRLAALHGGQQNNAIPRECEAILFVQDMPACIGVLQAYGTELEQELSAEDKGFRLHISRAKGTFDCALTYRDTSRAISAILLSQNGVLSMCADMPDQVETSTNVGVVSVTSERTEIISCDRSCVASKLADVLTRHRRLAHVLEANLEVTGEYPAWKPIYGSPLQES
jgi:dipeptidase D